MNTRHKPFPVKCNECGRAMTSRYKRPHYRCRTCYQRLYKRRRREQEAT